MIICIFIILYGRSKKELRTIYHALNAVLLKYANVDKTKSKDARKRTSMSKNVVRHMDILLSSIIQRLCPACRVSRTETAKYLSFAQILRYVTGTYPFSHSIM